ncbi:DUF4157 domain-containing protein [Pseudomonas sp. R5(2019)]|uniref:eCIS core domain-containing protein n=1 Tax=Pseudomonas sp. R5(2019) TaxID=2697566 RepID=UPI001412A77D|nr:DUF4157 domain-containing protein [Pseudomonas sp. R5(2019)]NBA98047.1 DUF4157 domain-containing protein [Pseudomonas sp. R5(2019)]
MPPLRILYSLPLAALLLGPATPAVAACPEGQYEICFTNCFCLPDPVRAQQDITRMAASALENWIVASRNNAVAQGTVAIPEPIRERLLDFYPASVLDAAQYSLGTLDELSAASAVMQNPDTNAVTMIDVIVFRDPQDALTNVALWAHELKHVQQYQEWGVAEFAARYTRDYEAVEAPGYEIQRKVAAAIAAKRL